MRDRVGHPSAAVVGREAELLALREFVESGGPPSQALVLFGGPGIGKTTLWEAAIAAARENGIRVLASRPAAAEAQLSFAALSDVFDRVDDGDLAELPAPQRHALEVALLRAEPAGRPPDMRAISLGTLNALRRMAGRDRLLVAIDDVQWLDSPSADALAFAVRRLERERIAFLLAKRAGEPTEFERSFGPDRVALIDVGPLSLGAIRRLLGERLGLSFPRYVLRRIFDTTVGNPLFALELARSLAEAELPTVGAELPVPDRVEDLLGTRVEGLADSIRRLLLAVALNAELRPDQLAALSDGDALHECVEAGLLVVDGDRVRASHPLLAAAAGKHASARDRRDLHRVLAGVVTDEELQARHLALGSDAPDGEIATAVAEAAHAASARGDWQAAAELGEHALRLTPAEDPERPKRAFYTGMALAVAGEKPRLERLLAAELESLPAGPARARLLLLMPGVVEDNDEVRRHFEQALEESRGDPPLHAAVLGNLSFNAAAVRYERIPEAERWAEEALGPARADPEIEQSVLYALAYARALRGRPLDDLSARFRSISGAMSYILASPERIAALRLVWRGEVDPARDALTRLLALAESGDALGYAHMRLHLCELELRAGEWARAERLLDEWAEPVEREILAWPAFERCQAHLAAGRGLASEARRWATEELARAEALSIPSHELDARSLLGLTELLDHDPAQAASSLAAVWDHTEREGIEEPGVFPVASDLVEARVELNDLEAARAVTARLRQLAERQAHPWGLPTARRCEALLRLTSGYDEREAQALEQTSADYEALGLRFDAARSMLLLGRVLRRHRKWGSARRALELAAGAFDELDSPGWAVEARSELARVGARRPAREGTLTPTERRVVELASDGLANREIAQAMFVSVKTVEGHLSQAYAKLGVRSRAQLARRLADGT